MIKPYNVSKIMNSKINFTAIIIARMNSSRMPGKSMAELCGKPSLYWLIQRAKKSKFISDIAIATTSDPIDDVIFKLATQENVKCFRGNENDILGRIANCAKDFNAEAIVKLTGDCPLIDYNLIDQMCEFFLNNIDKDYVKNFPWPPDDLSKRYPRGMEIEVFHAKSLYQLNDSTTDPLVREIVTEPFYTWPEYKFATLPLNKNLLRPNYRVCIDTPQDYAVVKKIFEHHAKNPQEISIQNVVNFLDQNPEIQAINAIIKQTKYQTSLIGLGKIGSELDYNNTTSTPLSHAGAIIRWSKTFLTSACDPDPIKIAQFKKHWKILNTYSSVDELFKNESPQVAVIATPWDSHYEILEKCIKNNTKAILCEKPFITNIENAKKIIELAKNNEITLAINYWMRYSTLFNNLKIFLDNGELGHIESIRYHYSKGLFNSGTHGIDLLRFLFGEVQSVQATNHIEIDTGDHNYGAVLFFNKNLIANLTVSDYAQHFTTELDIMGSKGRIVISDVNSYEIKLYKVKNHRLTQENSIPFATDLGNYMVKAIENLVYSMEKIDILKCSAEDGLKAILIANFIKESHKKNNKTIKIQS